MQVDEAGGEQFEVLAANWQTVTAWMTVQTQFTPGGLRYEGVEAGLRLAGIDRTPDLFDGLKVMEAAALEALAELR